MDGFFHKSSSPAIKVLLAGMLTKHPVEEEAIIDTGFTGFISVPLIKAFPLGLVLIGTADFTLADGSIEPTLLALGNVILEGEKYSGIFSLSKGSDILLGMEFLKKIKRELRIDAAQNSVALIKAIGSSLV